MREPHRHQPVVSARKFSLALALAWGLASGSPAPAALMAHWHFNEESPGLFASSITNAVLDSSGHGRHLTAAGNPLPRYTAGSPLYNSGSALGFTSGTDRLQTAQTAPFNFGLEDSFTLEAVVRTPPGANFTGNIVGRDWGSGLPSWWFRLEAGFPRMFLEGGGVSSITSGTAVNDGEWHHVAAVRDTLNRKVRVYVDHVLTGETVDSLTTSPTNSQSLVVAAYNNGQRQFEGEIDFVRISTGALIPADFVPPSLAIIDLQPANGQTFCDPSGGIAFTVLADAGVDPEDIQFFLNGTNHSGGLQISGTSQSRTVRLDQLAVNVDYTAHISVTDRQTNHLQRTLQFDTFEGHTTPVYVRGEMGYHTYRIPAMLVTARGDLLAFAEARKNSASDAGDIDLVVKRSSDNGRTWSSMDVIWSDGANTIGNPCPVVDRSNGTIWLPFCRNNDRVFVTKSTDNGLSWANPVEVTTTTKLPSWGWYATGPGVGIQLQRGTYKGRLVIPCDNTENSATNKIANSHIIFSDDHGATWQVGGVISPKVNECQVVELADGRLLMNMRNAEATQDYRALSTSPDGGRTWSPVTQDDTLIEPICQASFLRYTLASEHGRNRLIFSNPAHVSSRVNLTIRLSYDEGQSWPVARTLHTAAAAYSCLAVLADNSLGCLYEAGVTSPYESITFSRFNLPWLTGGKDRLNARTAELRKSGAQAVLSWPAEYDGAIIEKTAAPANSNSWIPVAVPQSILGDQRTAILDTTSEQAFFRLLWTNTVP